ncbi:MAG: nitroreductase [Rhodospirillales bacterium]
MHSGDKGRDFGGFDGLMRSRRSVRRFLDRPVPRALVEDILRLARLAPSGANLQPGKVYGLAGAPLSRLAEALSAAFLSGDKGDEEYSYFPKPMPRHLLERQHAAGWALYGSLGIGRRDVAARRRQHERNYRFFDAPAGLVVTIERAMGAGCYMDMGLFLQSILLAAKAAGLDSCAIGALSPYHRVVRDHLPIPDDEIVVCGMALGYGDDDAPENAFETARAPLDDYADFSGFDAD